MRSEAPSPPIARWLVAVSTPAADRDSQVGDLEERFARRVESLGAARARWWYRRQAARMALVLLPRRALAALGSLLTSGTLRSSWRALRCSPGTSLAAMATLAVGIAGPSAMLALAAGTTSPLPGDEGRRVVRMSIVDRTGRVHPGIVEPLLEAWQEGAVGPADPLTAMAAYQYDASSQVPFGGGGETPAGRYRGVYATPEVFEMLGVLPLTGGFYADDPKSGVPGMLIREDLWERDFERDPDVVGQIVRVDGTDRVVVGVLPESFGFPVNDRIWMEPTSEQEPIWSVVGRLAPGVGPDAARDRLQAILDAGPLGEQAEGTLRVRVEGFTDAHFGGEDETARTVGLISLILVLVAAVNVANVILARTVSRSRETAIRRALGASRGHIAAHTLSEVALLALGGGLLGVCLGRIGLQVMVRYLSSQAVVEPYWMDFSMGPRSMLLAVSLAALSIMVAAIPALRTKMIPARNPLQPGRLRRFGRTGRVMTIIVGLEVTLSGFLLTVSGGAIDNAVTLLQTGAGFPAEGVVTGRFLLQGTDYDDPTTRADFLARVRSGLLSEPSVAAAALTTALPGKEGFFGPVGVVPLEGNPTEAPIAQVRMIDEGFFPMLGISAEAGRLPTPAGDPDGAAVAIVNRAFVQARGISGDAVGRRITMAPPGGEVDTATVVAVVDDVGVTPHVRGRPSPGVYLSLPSAPPSSAYVMLNTSSTSVREIWHDAVAPLDPYLPLGDILTLDETQRRGHGAATLYLNVFFGLGAATLLIVLVGLHGVHAFLMAERVRDVGVRRALGAPAARILRESVLRGLRPVGIGLVLGCVPGVLAWRSFLPDEPSVLALALPPLLLLTLSVWAVWGPTRRATELHPMDVLREE